MEIPLQTTYRGVDPSDALGRLIQSEGSKLDHLFNRIVSCRVIVEREQLHHGNAAPYHVKVELGVPGNELLAETMDRDAASAVRGAFRRARRRLHDYAERLTAL